MKRKLIIGSIKKNKFLTFITFLSIFISSTLIFTFSFIFSSLRTYLIDEVKENVGDYHVAFEKKHIKDTSKIKKIEIKDGKSYVTYLNPSDVYKSSFKLCANKCEYNDALLSLYGVSPKNILIKIIVLVLIIISFFSFIVIKNIFDIQRKMNKKYYSILYSLGMDKKNIFKIEMLKSMLIFLISILFSLVVSFFLTKLFIYVLNNKLDTIKLEFSLYFVFLIIGFIFSFITVFLSSFLPLLKISLKNMNDNLNENPKKRNLRFKNIYSFLLGFEGKIAYINYKRNKKSYLVIVRCIWISVCLITVFYLIYGYSLKALDKYVIKPNYDSQIITNSNYDFSSFILKNKIDDFINFDFCIYKTKFSKEDYFDKKNYHDLVTLMLVNYDKENTFVLNKVNEFVLKKEKMLLYDNKLFKNGVDVNLDGKILENVSLSNDVPNFLKTFTTSKNIIVNVPNLDCESSSMLIYNGKGNVKDIKTEFVYYDAKKSLDILDGIFLGIKIIMISFTIFILLLIFTSIMSISMCNLTIRKKEMAVLKTYGYTNLNFIKMFFYESIFIIVRALVSSALLMIIICLFMESSINLVMSVTKVKPYFYVFKFFVYSFLLVFLSFIFTYYYLNSKNVSDNL